SNLPLDSRAAASQGILGGPLVACWRLAAAAEAGLGRADQDRRVTRRTIALAHLPVNLSDLIEGHHPSYARVDHALSNQVVVGERLLVIRTVRALEALLAHPQVA